MNAMQKSEKDRLAEEVVDRWVSFQMALYNKRKYPAGEFNAFAQVSADTLQGLVVIHSFIGR